MLVTSFSNLLSITELSLANQQRKNNESTYLRVLLLIKPPLVSVRSAVTAPTHHRLSSSLFIRKSTLVVTFRRRCEVSPGIYLGTKSNLFHT